jgi:hypothetical protein
MCVAGDPQASLQASSLKQIAFLDHLLAYSLVNSLRPAIALKEGYKNNKTKATSRHWKCWQQEQHKMVKRLATGNFSNQCE